MPLRAPNLVDLSTFGIHINNPGDRCCRCRSSVRGWSEAIFADELCSNCKDVVGNRNGQRVRIGRREGMFYRPRTIYVLHPQMRESHMITIWDGVRLPQRSHQVLRCAMRIDGELYVGRDRGNYVSLYDRQGNLCRDFGLEISREHMLALYELQRQATN